MKIATDGLEEMFSLCVIKFALEFLLQHFEPCEESQTYLLVGADELLETVNTLLPPTKELI